MAMRGCGQKRLGQAVRGLKVFIPLHFVLWAGVCYSYAWTSSPTADRCRMWYMLGISLCVFCLIPFPAAGSDCCLGCCGAAILVTVMKYVVGPRISVMASARPTCSLY